MNDFLPQSPLSDKQLFQYAAEHGIRYVQFGDNYPLHQLSQEDRRQLKAEALQKNIHLQAGTRRLTYNHVLEYIRIAQDIRSPFLRVVIDDAGYHPSKEEVIHIIKDILPVLKENQIILAIENHDRFKARVLEEIILKTNPEYVGVCLDTSNSLGAGEGICEILPILLPYTINLHIKDFVIKRVSHKMGFIVHGVPAGSGMLDVPWLLSECRKNKKCETATLEIWMHPLATIEETIEQEKHWVQQSIQYLKKFIS